MIIPRELDESCCRDVRGEISGFLYLDIQVAGAVKHQRRHGNGRKYRADVCLCVETRERLRRPGARAEAQICAPPRDERRITGDRRSQRVEIGLSAPVRLEQIHPAMPLFGCRRPWIIRRPHAFGE